jgi:hypothetical protein
MREARVIETIKAGEVALRVVGATELERLLQADKITREQFDTGERLRELWYASGLDGYGASWHGCACTDVRRGSRFACMSEKQEHAWRTYARAMRSLHPACRREVERVAVRDETAQCLRRLRCGLDRISKVVAG